MVQPGGRLVQPRNHSSFSELAIATGILTASHGQGLILGNNNWSQILGGNASMIWFDDKSTDSSPPLAGHGRLGNQSE